MLAFFAGLSPCLIGLEACASAHYWARELRALGHAVRLIPPQYVHPFVKTNKNDATDAEAICEALMRPTMRFAAVKSAEQQSVLMLHRARELLVRQRTMLINALRGHCGEFGMVVAQGASKVTILIEMIEDRDDARLPALAREALGSLVEQLRMAQTQILDLEKQLKAWHRTNEASRRLEAIPGVGVITATALVATIGDASQFHSGRQLAAWLGLVPRQYSSGGKARLGRIEAPVKAERELIEIGLKMLMADTVMDADEPRFQIGEDEMDDRQIVLGNLWVAALGNGKVFIPALAEAGISTPIVSDGQRPRSNGALHEPTKRVGAPIGYYGEPDTPGIASVLSLVLRGSRFPMTNLDGTSDENLVVDTPAFAASPSTNPCLV